ncbi:MAG: penicillin-binding transpeptidase domain-containing protein, partial [Acidimicrobiales bacterium]|nr:penicillin-binding transpeptidase domain-containing protein [Acidimicrobiales bacterium]
MNRGQRGAAHPLRLAILAVVVVALFAALFARLWYLQVLSGDEFIEAAESNRLRIVQVEAPRGRILDRDGQVLVDNRASTVATVDRARFDELSESTQQEMLARLADELTRYGTPTTVEELWDRVRDVRFSRYAPVPVASDVTEELKIYVEEHADEFPTVAVERRPVRRYVFGTRAAHLVGYIGEISDAELEARADNERPYVRGDRIGKSGIERAYEAELRGRSAQIAYEVDSRGRPVRVVEELSRPAIPGNDVTLTIDVRIQAYAEDLLVEALDAARARQPRNGPPHAATGGSVVVLDPQDGAVLAMASAPTYDPGDFVNGISADRWAYLTDPANSYPINNRAVQGQYAPGSTFKLFTGYAALDAGLRRPEDVFRDTGSYTLEQCTGRCTFRNAGSKAYGDVDMQRAMTVSSDAYFYA